MPPNSKRKSNVENFCNKQEKLREVIGTKEKAAINNHVLKHHARAAKQQVVNKNN